MSRSICQVTFIMLVLLIPGISAGAPPQSGLTDIAGGRGGGGFSDPEPQPGTRVAEVHVRSGDHVDSVQMLLALPDGRTIMTPRHGGSGGRLDIFRLDPGEYVTGLSGRCGDVIDSLRIQTNRRTSQLFGGRGGDRDFVIGVPAGTQAVGFTGRAGDFLDAVGLAYATIRQVQGQQTTLAGGRGGSAFADSDVPLRARIVEVRVRYGDRIDSVQAVYLTSDGNTVEGARRGGRGGTEGRFRLDADEYIIGLSGRCGDQVDSLRIHTNKRTSEVFGGRGGRDFHIEVPGGTQATGFAGRAGQFLDAIGLTYGSLMQNQPARRLRWPRR